MVSDAGCIVCFCWFPVKMCRVVQSMWAAVGSVALNLGWVGRSSTRPVLKHGPRSLTYVQVFQSWIGLWGEMKVISMILVFPQGDPGRNIDPLAWPYDHWAEFEHIRWYPKDGELCLGRTKQRKLWWRSVAILTCKSIVRPGYRGERLIEPSSSWFLPKFPSG